MILIRPDNSKIKCEFLDCFAGMGQAGRGWCTGAWWMQCCPQYEQEDKVLKDWEKRFKEDAELDLMEI